MAEILTSMCAALVAGWLDPALHADLDRAPRFQSGLGRVPVWVEGDHRCAALICADDGGMQVLHVARAGGVCQMSLGTLITGARGAERNPPNPRQSRIAGPPVVQAALAEARDAAVSGASELRFQSATSVVTLSAGPEPTAGPLAAPDTGIHVFQNGSGDVLGVLSLNERRQSARFTSIALMGEAFAAFPTATAVLIMGEDALIAAGSTVGRMHASGVTQRLTVADDPAAAPWSDLARAACEFSIVGDRVALRATLQLHRMIEALPALNPETCRPFP